MLATTAMLAGSLICRSLSPLSRRSRHQQQRQSIGGGSSSSDERQSKQSSKQAPKSEPSLMNHLIIGTAK